VLNGHIYSLFQFMEVTKMETTNEKLLLKPDEVAKVLSICPRSLWQLTKDGKIPCVRINHSVRYDPKDLTEFINNQKKQAS